MPGPVVAGLGPAYRRARRSWQWRTCGADLALTQAPEASCPFPVAEHHSVLLRKLAGVDPQLQRNKVVNLRLASARLDGLVLRPGQRLSFWKQVGHATSRRGYLPGLVLVDGRVTSGVGGGLCR